MTDPTLHSEDDAVSPAGRRSWRFWIRMVVAGSFVAGIVVLTYFFDEAAVLEALAAREAQAQAFRVEHPVAVYGVAFLLYVAVTGLSLPGAAVLTILYGWFFDLLPAFVLISFASTAGATLAMLLSRYLLRNAVRQRFGTRLEAFNTALEREGAWYLLTLRLIPAVPFFVINLVMGLTPIKVRTYWWVSQIGMLPGTFVYTYAGDSFPRIGDIQEVVAEHGLSGLLSHSGGVNLGRLLFAMILLGLLPVVLKFAVKWLRPAGAAAAVGDAPPQSDSTEPSENLE